MEEVTRRKIKGICFCGCGRPVNLGKKYIYGHQNKGKTKETNPSLSHSDECKRKISDALRGRHLSKETKQKISKGVTGKNVGRHITEDQKEKISGAHLGIRLSKEHVEKIRLTSTGRRHSEESKQKTSTTTMGHVVSKETMKKIGDSHRGVTKEINPNLARSKEAREKSRKFMLEIWQDPVFKEKQVKAIFSGLDLRPTKPEQRLTKLLDVLFPNEYQYVGNGKIIIGFKNPDFININNQKKIIELFGDFWHSEKKTRRTKIEEENQRVKRFAKYGYQTLIVWECELKDIKFLSEKLIKFNES